MQRLRSYRSWWQPLPAWLKLVTLLGIYPAGSFMVFWILTGASKSTEALLAFGVCLLCTRMHAADDSLGRGEGQAGNGVSFGDGE